jgi:hypothetical protein
MIKGYVLKADIKHYFQTVYHEILIRIIKRKIRDEKVIWLIRKILKNNPAKSNKEMPLGNLTSQFFANVYLNELDYFVKHKLKAKYYLRYVDDFVILHKSKERLIEYKKQIKNFLKTIKLELHSEKSKIIPLYKGINLLGFRVFYYHRLLKKSNIRIFNRRLLRYKEKHKRKEISYDELTERVEGWLAYAEIGDTYKMRKRIIKIVEEYFNDK